jgi:putative intracellular protease/amidase
MATINPKKIYKLAVCLYPKLTTLDFQGPLELIGGLSVEILKAYAPLIPNSMDPVRPGTGPDLVPTKTYGDMMDTHFDIIMVPGGPGTSF